MDACRVVTVLRLQHFEIDRKIAALREEKQQPESLGSSSDSALIREGRLILTIELTEHVF